MDYERPEWKKTLTCEKKVVFKRHVFCDTVRARDRRVNKYPGTVGFPSPFSFLNFIEQNHSRCSCEATALEGLGALVGNKIRRYATCDNEPVATTNRSRYTFAVADLYTTSVIKPSTSFWGHLNSNSQSKDSTACYWVNNDLRYYCYQINNYRTIKHYEIESIDNLKNGWKKGGKNEK